VQTITHRVIEQIAPRATVLLRAKARSNHASVIRNDAVSSFGSPLFTRRRVPFAQRSIGDIGL
jgi:hypothetical protein